MCGIFGFLLRPDAKLTYREAKGLLNDLYLLSESRGKESAGLYAYFPESGEAWTIKEARRARDMLQSPEYAQVTGQPLRAAFDGEDGRPKAPIALLAHSRLVTNGTAALQRNNQPTRWGDVTMIHNGIVVNVDELWAKNPQLDRHAEVDTEVMAALADEKLSNGINPAEATAQIFSTIQGAASIAWSRAGADWIVLSTNTGDIFYASDPDLGCTVFASERYILDQSVAKLNGSAEALKSGVTWLPPGNGIVFGLTTQQPERFPLSGNGQTDWPTVPLNGAGPVVQHDLTAADLPAPQINTSGVDESLLRYGEKSIAGLKRCTRCILPETFPFIAFDDQGVCNYCHGYKPRYAGRDAKADKAKFIADMQRYRTKDGTPDTLVAFSGGRDSSYGLHLIKEEFGLTPVTFTYDWGMVTDLARRNIARICGQLGVQNILVSADIKAKRENIRKNVSAWLKAPDLGLVPLFMAGDKHFFRVVNQLKKQMGITLDLWSANPLENTDFKTGFCGVAPDFDKSRVDFLSVGRRARMAGYYGLNFLKNPAYLNSSLLDTAGAFFAYYFEPRRDFYFMFDHFEWNEQEVEKTLLGEYDWELAPDTDSSWRIGDGTAPFYNYIYVTARGFSEFDTFRSNQIREGMLTREDAMAAVVSNNRPRAESLRWYLDTVGLDFNNTIQAINRLDSAGLHG